MIAFLSRVKGNYENIDFKVKLKAQKTQTVKNLLD